MCSVKKPHCRRNLCRCVPDISTKALCPMAAAPARPAVAVHTGSLSSLTAAKMQGAWLERTWLNGQLSDSLRATVLGLLTFITAHAHTQRALLVVISCTALSVASGPDSSRRLQEVSEPLQEVSGRRRGVYSEVRFCTFGRSTSCCFGWRNVSGVCRPVCKQPCRHGVCVGPDKCSCAAGHQGLQCDHDVNECGLPEGPCHHRCMNTHGSYRCYCDPGYTLDTVGRTCTKEPECSSLRCQFGCQIESGGGVLCRCPPGLHLAADNKTCESGPRLQLQVQR
ncbi:hypothetical protein DPEC_G00182990 [Dallia pectoralis]|uniref:Uncharacterized protein n=1 Tax=Dallia pectoralis TaxID=75939 RepID=A0ACC2GAM7_DALPE|nr:hypothetical protein DPEC_G00182990 [Dallia pectoralis]